MSQRTNTRRSFLKKAAGAAIAVPTIATVPLMGEDAPSNKATIGFIGTGNNGTNWMGRFLGYGKLMLDARFVEDEELPFTHRPETFGKLIHYNNDLTQDVNLALATNDIQ